MALFSNQWLKGARSKDRGHEAIPVTLHCKLPEYPKLAPYTKYISIRRADRDYNNLYLNDDDIEQLVAFLRPPSEESAMKTLEAMSDADLLDFMERLLAQRTKLKKKQQK